MIRGEKRSAGISQDQLGHVAAIPKKETPP